MNQTNQTKIKFEFKTYIGVVEEFQAAGLIQTVLLSLFALERQSDDVLVVLIGAAGRGDGTAPGIGSADQVVGTGRRHRIMLAQIVVILQYLLLLLLLEMVVVVVVLDVLVVVKRNVIDVRLVEPVVLVPLVLHHQVMTQQRMIGRFQRQVLARRRRSHAARRRVFRHRRRTRSSERMDQR